jgi:TOMM system kinase/cyclase fusion protein
MRCTKCGYENPDGMNFCGKCATSLGPGCPNCGFKNPPGFEYCGKCAAPIPTTKQVEKNKEAQLPSNETPTPDAERRQITVMFCDLVGSTALSEKLDPEDMRQVMEEYQEACAKVIRRFEGYIAKYLGDGILIYFGYPKAHEDDAQRAVRAGLEIVGGVGAMSYASSAQPSTRTTHESPVQPRSNETLQVRIGIHTGLVVAGEMGIKEKPETMAIVGETPNIAARVQEIAEPNSVLISSSTHKLVEGYFEFANLGPQKLKGISSPITVYRAIKESDVRSRLEIAVSRGLTPLIGREQELGLLLERWDRIKDHMGQAVLLSGEAGIGKSRLVRALKEGLVNESYVGIENRCSPYYQNSALYPVIDHLERLLEFKRQDSHQRKLNKLEKTIGMYDFPRQDTVPLFASLLSIPLTDQYPPLNLTPERQKQKTTEALIAWLLEEAEKQPVLYIVEDLHWVDPSTLEYLTLLSEQVATARIFALFTFRPDFTPPWPMRSHLNQIMIGRLPQKQVELMVERVANNKPLPPEVVQNITAKTDGVPLYVEELTKMVLESGLLEEKNGKYELTGPLPQLAIPATLHDSLMARLDRITTGEICGLAATLGRSFTYELIDAVSSHDETVLQRELNRLVDAELIYQRGLPPNSSYMFKHALIQEAAYQSLLKSKRRRYHEKIAQVLEERFQDIAENQPEILAHHYTEAGLIDGAIDHWKKAGLKSRERSANIEAIRQLTKGLKLLKTLSDTSERAKKELDLQIYLAPAWMALEGYASPEVEQAYTRARELCEQIGETPHLFPVLWGLWVIYHVRGDLNRARGFGDQLLHFAECIKDRSLLVEAHRNLGASLFFLGELEPALAHLEKSQALYDSQKHRFHISLFGQDPGVASLSYGSWTLWLRGYPDQAVERVYEALTLARELSHPFSLGYALTFAAWIHQSRGEVKAVQEQSEAAFKLCAEQGFEHWGAWATILLGWGLTELGQKEEGIAQIRDGLTNSKARGSELLRPYFLSLLAEACGKAGQAEEAFKVLDEAIDTINRNKERVHEVEIYRLKGELLLNVSENNKEDAEKNFRQALMTAQAQSAKSLELRTALSFSRHLLKQGKKEEAQKMLSEIYGWFTEGFDTRDLNEAKALLEELS